KISVFLETIVRKRLVRLCHLVHIFFSLYGSARIVCSIHDFVRQSLLHGLLASLAGEHGQPAKSQRLTSLCANLDGYLIGSSADTSCFYLKNGHDVVHGLLKHFDSRLVCLLCYALECSVYDLLCYALLTV